MIQLDTIFNEDCLVGMKRIPDGSVDLTVTSPPYDNLRTYNGYCFDFENIARELYRVTKQGGVVVWVVGDATIDGDETGTSFRQALFFKEIGFKLNDTMIWLKPNPFPTMRHPRYCQQFEYMFVFSKGKVAMFNPIMVPCVKAGQQYNSTTREKNGGNPTRKFNVFTIHDEKVSGNVWPIGVAQEKTGHPAIFPEQLAADHIRSWSNEGDTVLDPFMGSGTTAIACIKGKRHFIGFEISKEYYDKACKRIWNEKRQLTLF